MWSAFKQRFAKPALELSSSQGYKILAATGVAVFVILLRAVGLLQGAEWAMSDLFLRSRPEQETDERLLVVGIDEEDLRQVGSWPISDAILADVIRRLDEFNPRVIGLDLYRDLAIEPGHEELVALFEQQENLIGIEKLEPQYSSHVSPPASSERTGGCRL